MLVREIMQCDVLTLKEDDSLHIGLVTMLKRGVRHAPVMRDGDLVGILSERNALAHRATHGRDGSVAAAMVAEPYVVDPETSLEAASGMMATHKIGCLPVVVRGKLVGIITRTDLLTAFAQEPVRHGPEAAYAKDVMQTQVLVARADDTLLDAAHRLLQNNIRHLPVVDGDGKLLGMLSDRDVRSALGDPKHLLDRGQLRGHFEAMRVGQAMTPNPASVSPDASIDEVSALLVNRRLSTLAVTDDEMHVVGVISYIDLLRRNLLQA
jgi:acetoin utilization protein AcuB